MIQGQGIEAEELGAEAGAQALHSEGQTEEELAEVSEEWGTAHGVLAAERP